MTAYRARRGRFLEDGPHTVEVFPATLEDGRAGREYTYGEGIIVDKVLVQPSAGNALKAAETRTSLKALTEETTLRIIGTGRDWPGGPHSLVKIIDGPAQYTGHTFQQSGQPTNYSASPMTRHFAVRVDALEAVAT